MIKVTCVRVGDINRKMKGQFIRVFKDLYELCDWIDKTWPKVCFVKVNEELTKEQLKWLQNRRKYYLRHKKSV